MVPGRGAQVFINKNKVTHIELSSSSEANLTFEKQVPIGMIFNILTIVCIRLKEPSNIFIFYDVMS